MDNIRFGAFVAQSRKEQGLTQKELAQRLNVTDKAVSKWETGKGFPDVKLLEPLAQALGVSLVELIRGERQQSDSLTAEEAERVVSQAMDQSQRVTARRYLRLLRWLLTAVGAAASCYLLFSAVIWRRTVSDLGIIGGADGPTAILISTSLTWPPDWFCLLFAGLVAVLCLALVLRVRRLEKDLR